MSEKSNEIKIVCVSNNLETFENVIGSNINMNKYPITVFDNSAENIGISKRYNTFIEENVTPESDFWIIFCHQDFGFREDPLEKIKKFDKNSLYGPIGVKSYFSIKAGLKGWLSQKIGYYPSIKFDKSKLFYIQKDEPTLGFVKRKLLGQISQGQNNSEFETIGRNITSEKEVSTVDCCCLIVHSSLINKYNLRFDENLNWHMYVEDFCIEAKSKYKIKSKAVQFDCYHLGIGNLNEDFYRAAKYVKEKHKLKYLKTTCIDD